jgi:hypothetical protein
MNRKVYFGNGTKQTWIPAPLTGLVASTNGFSIENQLLNGRAIIKRSSGSHRAFEASWLGSMNADAMEDNLYTIKDFSDGLYGQGPFYWLDPYAIDTNLLPPHWAAPMLSEQGWPTIATGPTTTYVATDANTKNYPTKSALFTFSSTAAFESAQKLTIIIPEGYKLHFGWHGSVNSGSATLALRMYNRDTGVTTDTNAAVLGVTSAVRTNTQVNGNTYSKAEIFIKKPSGATSAIEVAGMIAQVLPEANSVTQGNFISGRGTSALQFRGLPNFEYYSAAINDGQVGLSASFLEV